MEPKPKSLNFADISKPLPPLPEVPSKGNQSTDRNLQATLFHQIGTARVDGGIFIGGTGSTVIFGAAPSQIEHAIPQNRQPVSRELMLKGQSSNH